MIQTTLNPALRAQLQWTPLQYMLDNFQQTGLYEAYLSDDGKGCALVHGFHLFFGGDITEDFVIDLRDHYFTEERAKAFCACIVFYQKEETAVLLEACFPKERTHRNGRFLYRLDAASQEAEERPGIVPITKALLASDTENLDMIREEIIGTGTYPDLGAFCVDGLGQALVLDGRVEGFCTSEYPSENGVAIGIEVTEAHQRKGYAKAMTRRLVRKAFERGYPCVYWECWQRNLPSVTTALSCGFTKVAEMPIVFLSFEEEQFM